MRAPYTNRNRLLDHIMTFIDDNEIAYNRHPKSLTSLELLDGVVEVLPGFLRGYLSSFADSFGDTCKMPIAATYSKIAQLEYIFRCAWKGWSCVIVQSANSR